jgi:hypothetical protein
MMASSFGTLDKQLFNPTLRLQSKTTKKKQLQMQAQEQWTLQ